MLFYSLNAALKTAEAFVDLALNHIGKPRLRLELRVDILPVLL